MLILFLFVFAFSSHLESLPAKLDGGDIAAAMLGDGLGKSKRICPGSMRNKPRFSSWAFKI